jgi:hypothetical protein
MFNNDKVMLVFPLGGKNTFYFFPFLEGGGGRGRG